VRRHAKSDGVVLIAVLLEFKRVVALMAVDYKQAMCANSTPFCMLVKVL
jgi:hypothetical protein